MQLFRGFTKLKFSSESFNIHIFDKPFKLHHTRSVSDFKRGVAALIIKKQQVVTQF